MPTIVITIELDIDRPAAEVWTVLADYGNDPSWRRGVATMAPSPPGPVQVGTTTTEQLRFAGQTRHNPGEVIAVEPGRSFRWRTRDGGADAEGSRTVVALDDRRSRVRLELTVRPHGFDALLAPLLGPMLRRTIRGDLARLQSLVLAGAPAPNPV
jgi:uncharacterized protein YndB with AHSA1/START domain